MMKFKAKIQMVVADRTIDVQTTFFAEHISDAEWLLGLAFNNITRIDCLSPCDVNNDDIMEGRQPTIRGHEVGGESPNRRRRPGQGRQGPEIDDL